MSELPAPRALLLDLDGTLIDSAPDLARALGAMFLARGLQPLDLATVRSHVGHGIGGLVEGAFAEAGMPLWGDALDAARNEMMGRYAGALTEKTMLLDGAEALVATCALRRIRLACVTNKPATMARTILEYFGLANRFALVLGGDGPLPRKPAPEPLLAAIGRLGVSRREAWMVGDGVPDMQAARAAGIAAVAVHSDYGRERPEAGMADVFADDLHDVMLLLDRVCAAA